MKIKHLKRYFIGIAMTAFLALLAGNAFADKLITEKNPTRDYGDGTKCGADCNKWSNNYMVVSPYWQSEGGSSYTFVAVSHSSLSGMASQIGVIINAIDSTGTAYDTAESFTVTAGNTQRVFIVPTNHATINSTNISSAVFLSGTTDFTYGHLRIQPQTTHPQLKAGGSIGVKGFGDGFRDSTMLTYWGSVIVEANVTGFAMEFIGDMNDSQTLPVSALTSNGALNFPHEKYMASGVNLN